jgi:hypothetical protein
MPIVALWAGCRNKEAGREDKPGMFLDRNRLHIVAMPDVSVMLPNLIP